MRTSLKMLVIAAVIIMPFRADSAPAEADAKPAVSKITEVTVYADRSRVTRVAPAELPVVARKSQTEGEAAPAAGLRMQILDLESKF